LALTSPSALAWRSRGVRGLDLFRGGDGGLEETRRVETLTAPGFASREYLVRLLRGFCSPVLVALIVGLTPAAYADPPDPSWIGGYWDDDDFDNVVAFIASTCAIAVLCTVEAGPRWAPVARVEPCEPNAAPAPLRSIASSRAPPVGFTPYSC
jgi:hypothetical protein